PPGRPTARSPGGSSSARKRSNRMSPQSFGSSRSPTGHEQRCSRSRRASLIRKLFPPPPPRPREPFAWLRFPHPPPAPLGLLGVEPSAWPLYVSVLLVLTLEWPFHIQLVEDMEIYPSAEWTSAAAAYILGAALLPIFWLSATLGFFLIFVLDSAGLVRADG